MTPALENRFYELYLEYFHRAEANRRWNLQQDIPWNAIIPCADPDVASVVEAFMAVELFLPDYTSKILHLVRASRGRAWFQANWGYEESKHSLALEMWLTRSGSRTERQVCEFGEMILGREWNLPYATPLEMMAYTTLQEFATALNYRRLRKVAQHTGDPALVRLLALLARDEVGHFQFFKDGLQLYMRQDRDKVLETLNFVIHSFRMPAADIIPDWDRCGRIIGQLGIFDDRIYLRDVVRPVLQVLGVAVEELREARRRLNEASPRIAATSVAEPVA